MARGFGATLGAATTDRIVSAYTTIPTALTIAILANRNGEGGGDLGAFCETVGERVLFRNRAVDNACQFVRVWSGDDGNWRAPRGAVSTWNHYLVTYDGSATTNDPLLYLDGVSQTVTEVLNPSGTIDSTASAWWIGNRAADQSKCWDGILAEFAIWAGIFTPTQITFLNPSAGVFRSPAFIPANLVEYIPMIGAENFGLAGTPTITGTAIQTHPTVLYPWGVKRAMWRRWAA